MTIIQSILFCKQEATRTAKADNAAVLKALPFSDRQSLADAKRGLVAPVLNDEVVKNTEERVVWYLRIRGKMGIKYELAQLKSFTGVIYSKYVKKFSTVLKKNMVIGAEGQKLIAQDEKTFLEGAVC